MYSCSGVTHFRFGSLNNFVPKAFACICLVFLSVFMCIGYVPINNGRPGAIVLI